MATSLIEQRIAELELKQQQLTQSKHALWNMRLCRIAQGAAGLALLAALILAGYNGASLV